VVVLRDSDSGKEETYTVLGAWDGDPERGIISYQTAIGQALLGHKLGEVVKLTDHEETRRFAIISIEPAPVDVTPPDPSLTEVPAEAVAAEWPLFVPAIRYTLSHAVRGSRRNRRFHQRPICRDARSTGDVRRAAYRPDR